MIYLFLDVAPFLILHHEFHLLLLLLPIPAHGSPGLLPPGEVQVPGRTVQLVRQRGSHHSGLLQDPLISPQLASGKGLRLGLLRRAGF